MTIVLVGGGSGGHITPILAVADELKRERPQARLVYVGQKGDPLAAVPASSPLIDETHLIQAGKFRRYHGAGIKQILDIPTLLLNVRDLFLLLIGTWQSYFLLKKLRPDVIFTPGGFVGVPVGQAAAWRRIPFVTHDLDALPGLANRINARHAVIHAVGMPAELYSYPAETTKYVGVPTVRDFVPVTLALKQKYREEAGLNDFDPIIFVIGGGLGAQRLNEAILGVSGALLDKYPKLVLVHAVGRANDAAMEQAYDNELSPDARKRVIIKGYLDDVYRYSGAADLVISRAGATNTAEFAVQHKACIVVPNPQLTGGHQTKNAEYLADKGAIRLVTEAEMTADNMVLLGVILELLGDAAKRAELGEKLGAFARPDAAAELAKILLGVVGQGNV